MLSLSIDFLSYCLGFFYSPSSSLRSLYPQNFIELALIGFVGILIFKNQLFPRGILAIDH
jgi:hypothetical protein